MILISPHLLRIRPVVHLHAKTSISCSSGGFAFRDATRTGESGPRPLVRAKTRVITFFAFRDTYMREHEIRGKMKPGRR